MRLVEAKATLPDGKCRNQAGMIRQLAWCNEVCQDVLDGLVVGRCKVRNDGRRDRAQEVVNLVDPALAEDRGEIPYSNSF